MLSKAYRDGAKQALIDSGITKEAGIREFLKFLATGRSTLWHGTSAEAVKSIRELGLIPRFRKGVTDLVKEQGLDPTGGELLGFLTRLPSQAHEYALQQSFIESFGKRPNQVVQEFLRNPKKQLLKLRKAGLSKTLKDAKKLVKTMRQAKKGVIKAQLPIRKLPVVSNPEPEVLWNEVFKPIFSPVPNKTKERVVKSILKLPHAPSLGIRPRGKVAVPPEFIAGSPKYTRVTIPEIKEHLRYALNKPKETALEALRNLINWQEFSL